MVLDGISIGTFFCHTKFLKKRKAILELEPMIEKYQDDPDVNFFIINYDEKLNGDTIKILTNDIKVFTGTKVIEQDNFKEVLKDLLYQWEKQKEN